MDIGSIFLEILTVVSDSITALLSLLPNPDPFPEMMESFETMIIEESYPDMFPIAYYWLDSFFIADAVLTCLAGWFVMFPIAWVIMMLWKWMNAR